jgi:hypothetical protein
LVYLNAISKQTPPASTPTGIQKCASLKMAVIVFFIGFFRVEADGRNHDANRARLQAMRFSQARSFSLFSPYMAHEDSSIGRGALLKMQTCK